MRRRLTKATLPAVLLTAAMAAWAAPARAVTPEDIQSGLQDWLAEGLARSKFGVSIDLDGEVSVLEVGAGFRAIIPPIRLSLGAGTAPEISVDPITVDLQPLVSGGYAANWDLPDSIELRDADGTMVTITVGGQSGHGLYSPELGLMISSDLELLDIRAAASGRTPHLAIDSLQFSARYDAVAPGLFDQSTEFRIAGLTGLKPDGTEAMRIAAVTLSGGARNVDLAAWRDLRTALGASFGHRPKAGAEPPVQSAALTVEPRPALLTSLESRHRISDARFDLGDGSLSIGDGALDLTVDGLDSGSSSLAVAFTVADLDLPAAIGPLTPEQMTVDLVLRGLPTGRLFEALAALVAGAGLADSGHAVAMLGLHLQDAMMTSGASIEVNEILLIGDDARLRVAGTIRPTYAAPLGAIARLDISIGGLAGLVADARAEPADDETLRQLAVLQAVGTAGTDPDGTPVLRYALDITQQGQLLMNGADLMPALATAAP